MTPMQKKIADLEARVRALELRLGEKQYSKIDDNPPTVEHAFAIVQTLNAAKQLATMNLKSADPKARELSGEILSWLEAMGR
jgi:hypothetical protein